MTKTVEYFYTHGSPWTYLGSVHFHDMAKAAGAAIVYRPVALGKIFPLSGGLDSFELRLETNTTPPRSNWWDLSSVSLAVGSAST